VPSSGWGGTKSIQHTKSPKYPKPVYAFLRSPGAFSPILPSVSHAASSMLCCCCFCIATFAPVSLTYKQFRFALCNNIGLYSAGVLAKYVNVPLVARVVRLGMKPREGRLLGRGRESKTTAQSFHVFSERNGNFFFVLYDEAQSRQRQQRCGLDESQE
jgi:hypothetical protein